ARSAHWFQFLNSVATNLKGAVACKASKSASLISRDIRDPDLRTMASSKYRPHQGSDADVIVVGGGPAGLSGAQLLARAMLRVLLFDTGRQRNLSARGIHCYLTRDGMWPDTWLGMAGEEAIGDGV